MVGVLRRGWVADCRAAARFCLVYAALSAVVLTLAYGSVGIDREVEAAEDRLEVAAELLAVQVAEAAGQPLVRSYDWIVADRVLSKLAGDQDFRVQVFDRTGRMAGDTWSAGAGGRTAVVEVRRLNGIWSGLFSRVEGLFSEQPEAAAPSGIARVSEDDFVYRALEGHQASGLRLSPAGDLVVNVAVPITRLKTVLGALVVSQGGGEIERRVAVWRWERVRFVGLVLAAVFVVLFAGSRGGAFRSLAGRGDA